MVKMFKTKFLTMLPLLTLVACSSKDSKVSINFNKDSTAIVISNIAAPGFSVLKKYQLEGKDLGNVVAVLEMPGEDDSLSMEKEFPGQIVITEAEVLFKPNSAFLKGKNYLVSTIINARFGGTNEALKLKLNTKNQSTEKTLVR